MFNLRREKIALKNNHNCVRLQKGNHHYSKFYQKTTREISIHCEKTPITQFGPFDTLLDTEPHRLMCRGAHGAWTRTSPTINGVSMSLDLGRFARSVTSPVLALLTALCRQVDVMPSTCSYFATPNMINYLKKNLNLFCNT
jgi:hypothetical protein